MRQRDTFTFADESIDSHLWFVLSDPKIDNEQVVIANLTSWAAYKDQNVILNEGDHGWIRHKTCIHFREARIERGETLDRLIREEKLVLNERFTKETFAKIIAAALVTKELKSHIAAILQNQSDVGF